MSHDTRPTQVHPPLHGRSLEFATECGGPAERVLVHGGVDGLEQPVGHLHHPLQGTWRCCYRTGREL